MEERHTVYERINMEGEWDMEEKDEDVWTDDTPDINPDLHGI
jgi:hypothetical protein